MSLILLNLVTPEEEYRLALEDFSFEERWPQQVVGGWPRGEFIRCLHKYEAARERLHRANVVLQRLKSASQ